MREEINPGQPDDEGLTPLSNDGLCGHQEVERILLEQEDVNPDEPDDFGQTPLLHAAGRGHERP